MSISAIELLGVVPAGTAAGAMLVMVALSALAGVERGLNDALPGHRPTPERVSPPPVRSQRAGLQRAMLQRAGLQRAGRAQRYRVRGRARQPKIMLGCCRAGLGQPASSSKGPLLQPEGPSSLSEGGIG